MSGIAVVIGLAVFVVPASGQIGFIIIVAVGVAGTLAGLLFLRLLILPFKGTREFRQHTGIVRASA